MTTRSVQRQRLAVAPGAGGAGGGDIAAVPADPAPARPRSIAERQKVDLQAERRDVKFFKALHKSGANYALKLARCGRTVQASDMLRNGKCRGACTDDRCEEPAEFRCHACWSSQPCAGHRHESHQQVLVAVSRWKQGKPARGLSHACKRAPELLKLYAPKVVIDLAGLEAVEEACDACLSRLCTLERDSTECEEEWQAAMDAPPGPDRSAALDELTARRAGLSAESLAVDNEFLALQLALGICPCCAQFNALGAPIPKVPAQLQQVLYPTKSYAKSRKSENPDATRARAVRELMQRLWPARVRALIGLRPLLGSDAATLRTELNVLTRLLGGTNAAAQEARDAAAAARRAGDADAHALPWRQALSRFASTNPRAFPEDAFVVILHAPSVPQGDDGVVYASAFGRHATYTAAGLSGGIGEIVMVYMNGLGSGARAPPNGWGPKVSDFAQDGPLGETAVARLPVNAFFVITPSADALFVFRSTPRKDGDTDSERDDSGRPINDLVVAALRDVTIGERAAADDAATRAGYVASNVASMNVVCAMAKLSKGQAYGAPKHSGLPPLGSSARTSGASPPVSAEWLAVFCKQKATRGAHSAATATRMHDRVAYIAKRAGAGEAPPTSVVAVYPPKNGPRDSLRAYTMGMPLFALARNVGGVLEAAPTDGDAGRIGAICIDQNWAKLVVAMTVVPLQSVGVVRCSGDVHAKHVVNVATTAVKDAIERRNASQAALSAAAGGASSTARAERRRARGGGALLERIRALTAPADGPAADGTARPSLDRAPDRPPRRRSRRSASFSPPPLRPLAAIPVLDDYLSDPSLRASFAELISRECMVTLIASPCGTHVDRNAAGKASKDQPFLESLARVRLLARGRPRAAMRGEVSEWEGALLFPGLGWAITYAPDVDVVVVNLYYEAHAVVASDNVVDNVVYGVGGDKQFLVCTVADWPRK